MRKHTARHLLHACLDLLPVLLIPVFMIYSHRHNVASDLSIVENEPVYYKTNEVSSADDIYVGYIYQWNDNYTTNNSAAEQEVCRINKTLAFEQISILSGNVEDTSYIALYYVPNSRMRILQRFTNNTVNWVYISDLTFPFIVESKNTGLNINEVISCISSTNFLYIESYEVVTTTLPQDIMDSFLNQFNYAIDKYFNMGNVFNLNGVYQWFNTNIFGGTAPTVIYSVWNIVLYEFVMDLIFLLYALFMWFIDVTKRLIEKPLDSIK